MEWVGIRSSQGGIKKEVEKDVRSTVREEVSAENGIVLGGGLGLDYTILNEALRSDEAKVKVILPVNLESYAEFWKKRAGEGLLKKEDIEKALNQLENLKKKNPRALKNSGLALNGEEMHFEQNSKVIDAVDRLIVFRIKTGETSGEVALDAIKKARKKGVPVEAFQYDFT